jgi:hypothetical protein
MIEPITITVGALSAAFEGLSALKDRFSSNAKHAKKVIEFCSRITPILNELSERLKAEYPEGITLISAKLKVYATTGTR